LQRYRHFLSVAELTSEVIEVLLARSVALKQSLRTQMLANYTLALIFEKPSLRTRVSFELAMVEMGGSCLVLRPEEIQMGRRETIADIAAYLSRNVKVAALRVFAHATLTEFAAAARIPIINALSDLEHPCQAIADILTIQEHRGTVAGKRLAYVGDGNNVCHSLLLAASLTGMHMTVACPCGFEPAEEIVAKAREYGTRTGAIIEIGHDPSAAVRGADAIYTDVWASMGQEHEAVARKAKFAPFQINARLVAQAPEAIIMHCLPAHRGEEITNEVLDSNRSVVFDQAENRRHAQKAVLLYALGML
jgi:ornithine carbamoyltransferase